MSAVDPRDEGKHEPDSSDQLWNESWYFDFATLDGRLGGYVRVGLDLEWVEAAPAQMSAGLPRYEQACTVQGEVLVGDERIQVDGFGERDHSWGHRDWWTMPWCWTAGRLGDGTAFHAFRPLIDIPFASGFVAPLNN